MQWHIPQSKMFVLTLILTPFLWSPMAGYLPACSVLSPCLPEAASFLLIVKQFSLLREMNLESLTASTFQIWFLVLSLLVNGLTGFSAATGYKS